MVNLVGVQGSSVSASTLPEILERRLPWRMGSPERIRTVTSAILPSIPAKRGVRAVQDVHRGAGVVPVQPEVTDGRPGVLVAHQVGDPLDCDAQVLGSPTEGPAKHVVQVVRPLDPRVSERGDHHVDVYPVV